MSFVDRVPDRYVTGFGGMRQAIYSPLGLPKSREELTPFTFEIYATTDPRCIKAQEKFIKGLAKLNRPSGRRGQA